MASITPVWYWDPARQRPFLIRPHTDGYYWKVFQDTSEILRHPVTQQPLPVSLDVNREIPRLYRQVTVPPGQAAPPSASQGATPQQYVNLHQAYQNYSATAAQVQAQANAAASQAAAARANLLIDHRSTRIRGQTDGRTSERLDPSYQVRDHPRRFYKLGKVFQVLWHEPAGRGTTHVTEFTICRFQDERVHSKVRRFVVVREGHESCTAIPIHTYNGRGLTRPGVRKSEHGIIYTGREAPALTDNEKPTRGEEGIMPMPIRVTPTNRGEALDPLSRINFGKVYTVEFNIKARDFGEVHASDLQQALLGQFRDVFFNSG